VYFLVAAANSGGPIFVVANENRTPLTVVQDGTVLTLIRIGGDWYQVEFVDAQFGKRAGYIHKQYLKAAVFANPTAPQPHQQERAASPATPMNGDASAADTIKTPVAAGAAVSSRPQAAPSTTRAGVSDSVPANGKQYAPVEFKDAQVREQ
jgi:hypothetical protein